MIAENYLVRHFLRIQQALGGGDLGHAHRPPGAGNPADRLTKVRMDAAPLLRLLKSGGFRSGQLRPNEGRSLEGVRIACGALECNLHVHVQDGDPVLGG